MSAFVRVSGPPNSNFLVGYPGVSATLPRIEGKVEIRPAIGQSNAALISLVTVCLQRRESIHPTAESLTKGLMSAPRKEMVETVGKEMMLFKTVSGRDNESILAMDLPFMIFIPYGKGGEDQARRVPPASLQLPSRTAETMYELVVTVQTGHADQKKYFFPVPITRYDALSTFGMFNNPETYSKESDHVVNLAISMSRWSYGPLDPIQVYIKLSPHPDWMSKAKKVTIQALSITIEEEVTYNHEGDEPQRKTRSVAKKKQAVGVKMPEAGYLTNIGLVFPAKEDRDTEGIAPRGDRRFPRYAVQSFTTTGSLYKIEYFLVVKASLGSAKDIILRQRIVVSPYDNSTCKAEMEAIAQAARDAGSINQMNPMLPASMIVNARDPTGLKALGIAMVAGSRKPLID